MSKKTEIIKETPLANTEGKTVEELKEIAQTLQAQLQEHQKQANYHQTMATKAQGALEVMLQLIPKQEVEEMIAKEEEDNNSNNGEVVEG
jgi:Tfp pilus assembly protein PilN